MTERRFPNGFLWGTATAAHQVEGGNRNDWDRWERTPGRIRNGDTAEVAIDHYRRFREDFQLLAQLNNNAHRLSIEWSRVEPGPGEFDAGQIRHYREVLTELRQRGMAPMLTLHHFSSPLWFADRGGWAARGAAEAFAPFVRRVADELGDLVELWCTINEPNIYALQAYIFGSFPPGHRNDVPGLWRVLANFRRAHEDAYRAIKERHPDAPVGIVHNRFFLVPFNPRNPLDRATAAAGRRMLDYWPVGRGRLQRTVAASADFIGLNHYSGRLMRSGRQVNPAGYPISDFGDAVKVDWLREALVDLKQFDKPVYVTESGIATTDDSWRERFLVESLGEAWKAVEKDGVDLRGYFHWTAIDNFEWAHGYHMKFGLIGVEPGTLERRPKGSAHLYAQIAAANSLSKLRR